MLVLHQDLSLSVCEIVCDSLFVSVYVFVCMNMNVYVHV